MFDRRQAIGDGLVYPSSLSQLVKTIQDNSLNTLIGYKNISSQCTSLWGCYIILSVSLLKKTPHNNSRSSSNNLIGHIGFFFHYTHRHKPILNILTLMHSLDLCLHTKKCPPVPHQTHAPTLFWHFKCVSCFLFCVWLYLLWEMLDSASKTFIFSWDGIYQCWAVIRNSLRYIALVLIHNHSSQRNLGTDSLTFYKPISSSLDIS